MATFESEYDFIICGYVQFHNHDSDTRVLLDMTLSTA